MHVQRSPSQDVIHVNGFRTERTGMRHDNPIMAMTQSNDRFGLSNSDTF